ncbi:class C sortase [Microbacterium sp. SSM24]|uniref:class C sortase n=1 Tax=Microbacterium sp. SSM24 TaxID=2991714 RepID=UPI0022260DB2|nr:class C sortase [Microbacterium sp. SSM24]MCW3493391.1 class C sortase [Microbacterium sp. SSM24]
MTLLETPVPAAAPARPTSPSARDARWGWAQSMVMLIAVIGVGILVYPMAASWSAALKHDTDVDGYTRTIDSIPSEELDERVAEAREYNASLPSDLLRDPYALGADGQQTAVGEGSDAYFAQLTVPGTDAMGRVRIPAIDLDLPIFHGTDEATLARGVGHLYGSALPVGGVGTHSVLAGHNGYVQATLFDDIDELQEGDSIVVSTMGEDLYYEVDQTQIVLPDQSDALRPEPGHDYLTLVTCTPTGVNTHRLLVRAERVAAPTGEQTRSVIADDADAAGFPWWAIILVGVPTVAFFAVTPRRRRAVPSQS